MSKRLQPKLLGVVGAQVASHHAKRPVQTQQIYYFGRNCINIG